MIPYVPSYDNNVHVQYRYNAVWCCIYNKKKCQCVNRKTSNYIVVFTGYTLIYVDVIWCQHQGIYILNHVTYIWGTVQIHRVHILAIKYLLVVCLRYVCILHTLTTNYFKSLGAYICGCHNFIHTASFYFQNQNLTTKRCSHLHGLIISQCCLNSRFVTTPVLLAQ